MTDSGNVVAMDAHAATRDEQTEEAPKRASSSVKPCGCGGKEHVCGDSALNDEGPFNFSPSEHDAFCALWKAIVWEVVPHCHGRLPRPEEIVEQYFHEHTDAAVFLNRLIAPPFQLMKVAFLHDTAEHTGLTYDTASEQRWTNVAMRIRVKRELASPPTPEESLRAAIETRRARMLTLEKEKRAVEEELAEVKRAFEERLKSCADKLDAEKTALKAAEEALSGLEAAAARAREAAG